MTRSTPLYFQTSLPTMGGGGQRIAFWDAVVADIQVHQSNGVDAWESYDDISGVVANSDRDTVFRSLGDRNLGSGSRVGDANLFFRFRLNTNGFFYFGAYQDWSQTDNDGFGDATTLGGTSETGSLFFQLSDIDAVDYFGVVNTHEGVVVARQSGTTFYMAWGSPVRSHIPTSRAGIARQTGTYSSGSGVVVSLDRDISSVIRVNQAIWAYDVTDEASALIASPNYEFTTVDAVSASDITLNTVSNNHGAFGIIGLDPSPMYVFAASGATINLGLTSIYNFTNRIDATQSDNNNDSTQSSLIAGITEAEMDPGTLGVHPGVFSRFTMTDGPLEFRGRPEHHTYWTTGTQVAGDRMLPNDDAALARKFFPEISNGTQFGLGIGPGALV